MPHCRLGFELKVGDKVLIYATVTSVHAGLEFCNVTVLTDEVMPPNETGTHITLNTKQCETVLHDLSDH